MEEGTSKAIPLRRARGARVPAVQARRWVDGFRAGARLALTPPRQLWLASLGGTALTVRGAHAAWSRLVEEGAAAEAWLRGLSTRTTSDAEP